MATEETAMTADDAMLQRLIRQVNRYPNGGMWLVLWSPVHARPEMQLEIQTVGGRFFLEKAGQREDPMVLSVN